jgi:hypothetical protein
MWEMGIENRQKNVLELKENKQVIWCWRKKRGIRTLRDTEAEK